MTDLYDDLGRRTYAESLPPSLLSGGGGTPVGSSPWGTAAGDISATFATVTGVDPGTIADRPALVSHGTVGTAGMNQAGYPAFPAGAYVATLDGDWVSWNGNAWVDGPSPPPPPPPPPPVPNDGWTKADIVTWLADHGVTVTAEAQAALTKAELLALVADLLDDDADDPVAAAVAHLEALTA